MEKTETCLSCKKEFTDYNFMPELPLARRTLCNECLDKILNTDIRRSIKNE